jgi:uracil-DNA glycosylase
MGGLKRSKTASRRPRTAPSDPARAFERLSAEIRACRRCPLGATRRHAVIYRGGPRPTVVFVGEAPGAEEDRIGLPFVGRSGRLLDETLARLPLTPAEIGILNVVKCRPPQNRFDAAAARACRPYLDRQLELLRPTLLVPLGRHALRALDPSAPPILRSAGASRTTVRGTLFPLLHPAAALRSRRFRERWEHDAERLAAWLLDARSQTPYLAPSSGERAHR